MGKATIISGGTAGFYTVSYHFDTTSALVRRVDLDAEKAKILATDIPAAEANIVTAKAAIVTALAALDAAIPLFPTIVNESEMLRLQGVVVTRQRTKDVYVNELDAMKARLASINAEISRILNLTTLQVRNAWCADYTENLTGDIGTIEINGDTNNIVLRPGHQVEAWSYPRDGIAQQAVASPGAAQTFYNWAMRPGWQKWKPTHRVATVTAKTNTFGSTYVYDVTLVSAYAVDRLDGVFLDVNQSPTLTAVSASYLCGSKIYEVGDRVIVEFTGQDWNVPNIIGFESNPRECYPYRIKLFDHNGSVITPSTLLDVVDGSSQRKFLIGLFNSADVSVFSGTCVDGTLSGMTYNATTQEFNLLYTPTPATTYYIEVRMTHRVDMRYPGKYYIADWLNPADLTVPGAHSIIMHMFAKGNGVDVYTPSEVSATSYARSLVVYTSLPSYKVAYSVGRVGFPGCEIYLNVASSPDTYSITAPPGVFASSPYTYGTCYTPVLGGDYTYNLGATSGVSHYTTLTSSISVGADSAFPNLVSTPSVGEYNTGLVTTAYQGFKFRGTSF